MKTHYRPEGHNWAVCGRDTGRMSDQSHRVDCLNCKKQPEWVEADLMRIAAQEAAYEAQVPSTVVPQFGRVNSQGVMECYNCHGVLFKERPRSWFCYNYVCQGCGKTTSPLTESGMCN